MADGVRVAVVVAPARVVRQVNEPFGAGPLWQRALPVAPCFPQRDAVLGFTPRLPLHARRRNNYSFHFSGEDGGGGARSGVGDGFSSDSSSGGDGSDPSAGDEKGSNKGGARSGRAAGWAMVLASWVKLPFAVAVTNLVMLQLL